MNNIITKSETILSKTILSKTILGIDPGFSNTGFGVICKDKNALSLIECGTLRLPTSKSLAYRIQIFYDFLISQLQKHEINALAIETPFLGKNAQNFLKLGYLRGILYLVSAQHDLNVLEFSPREVKCALTGFGGADKEQVARVVYRFFPAVCKIPKLTSDLTDAIAITLCALWK